MMVNRSELSERDEETKEKEEKKEKQSPLSSIVIKHLGRTSGDINLILLSIQSIIAYRSQFLKCKESFFLCRGTLLECFVLLDQFDRLF